MHVEKLNEFEIKEIAFLFLKEIAHRKPKTAISMFDITSWTRVVGNVKFDVAYINNKEPKVLNVEITDFDVYLNGIKDEDACYILRDYLYSVKNPLIIK